jgi:hypothetical protein
MRVSAWVVTVLSHMLGRVAKSCTLLESCIGGGGGGKRGGVQAREGEECQCSCVYVCVCVCVCVYWGRTHDGSGDIAPTLHHTHAPTPYPHTDKSKWPWRYRESPPGCEYDWKTFPKVSCRVVTMLIVVIAYNTSESKFYYYLLQRLSTVCVCGKLLNSAICLSCRHSAQCV